MKTWKSVQAKGDLRKLTDCLNAIEKGMHGTVFAVLPWTEHHTGIATYSEPAWDVIYYVEPEGNHD